MISYFSANFTAIAITVGMLILTLIYPSKEGSVRLRLLGILLVNFILSLIIYFNGYLESMGPAGAEYVIVRRILSSVGYILRVFLPTCFTGLLIRDRRKRAALILIPLALCTFVYGASIFGWNLAFGISNDNIWFEGRYHFFGVVVGIVYVVMLLFLMMKDGNSFHKSKTIVLTFMAALCLGSILVESYAGSYSMVFPSAVAICCAFYYQYFSLIPSRIDPVTGIYNRSYYDTDVNRYKKRIRFAISVDVNGLKVLNDTKGHEEGDKALAAVGEALRRGTSERSVGPNVAMKAYRVGGDEFIVFGFSDNRTEISSFQIEQFMSYVKEMVITLGFSAAAGYQIREEGMSIPTLVSLADEKMYIQKKKMKGSRD